MEKEQEVFSIRIKRSKTGQTEIGSFWIKDSFSLGRSDEIPYSDFVRSNVEAKYKISPPALNILNQFYQAGFVFCSIMVMPFVIYVEKEIAEDNEANEKKWEAIENELIGIIYDVLGEKGEKNVIREYEKSA